jgi:hypothetical protein
MPAKQKPEKQIRADAFRACQEQQAAGRRGLCSSLLFWKACGRKKCLRARACVVDGNDCFRRFWPLVPEELKIAIRTTIKTRQAGLSRPETAAEIKRERARWRETMAPRAVPQAAAEPALQSPLIAPTAPSRRAPSPRVRVL